MPRLRIDSPPPAIRTLHSHGQSQAAQANRRWLAPAADKSTPEGAVLCTW